MKNNANTILDSILILFFGLLVSGFLGVILELMNVKNEYIFSYLIYLVIMIFLATKTSDRSFIKFLLNLNY